MMLADGVAHVAPEMTGQRIGETGESPLSIAMAARDRETVATVHEAIAEDRVILAFQPVVHAARPDRPAFHEALLRVVDRTGRIIPASEFIGAVEDVEAGRMLDTLALKHALEVLERVPDLRLAVNMSARSIAYPRWKQVLDAGLARDPTVAERLILEITERTAITVPDLVAVFMNDLQLRGISFALDDFGAGFSSFRSLKELYFDILKIDNAFIHGIHADPDNQVLVSAIQSLARHFEMFVVAEGVETLEDAEFLAGIGVDCLQGYYFGMPTIRPYWADGDPRDRMTA